jgi:cell division GTPase FtsZ
MSNNNRVLVPEAESELERLKQETAKELNVELHDYNPDIKAIDAGRIGGNMVKRMIETYEQEHSNR